MTDDEREALIENMAQKICNSSPADGWMYEVLDGETQDGWRRSARAALAVALPIIRKDALKDAEATCAGEYLTDPETHGEGDAAYDMAVRDCIVAIRKLSEDK